MVKYAELKMSKKMFELTKSNKVKKTKVNKKTKFFDTKDVTSVKTNFINRIIQRLNFFDISIILIIVVVLSFMLYNRTQRKPTTINIRMSVENVDWWYRGSPPESWYAKDLKVGDSIKDSFGNNSVEVLGIENYDSGGPYRNIYVNLKLNVSYNAKRNQYLYEYKPLAVGSSVTFNFPSQQIQGLIVGIGEINVEDRYKTIQIKHDKVIPDLANRIKIGDKTYDNNNKLIAEVIAIENSPSKSYQYSDIRGNYILTVNPDFRTTIVTLKTRVYNRLGIDFTVADAAIKIGNKVWFQFPKYALEDFQITNILN